MSVGLVLARPFFVEMTLKDRVSRATSVSITFLPHGYAWDRAGEQLSTITVNNPREVAELVRAVHVHSAMGHYDHQCKCFEGFEAHKERWPRATFVDPNGKKATIYLPYGDCGVWPKGLPWGWYSWQLADVAWKIISEKRDEDEGDGRWLP